MQNAQKGFIVPLVIVVIAAFSIGGGVYYAKKSKAARIESEARVTAEATTTASVSSNASTTIGVSTDGTLRALFAGGKNVACTFDNISSSEKVSGIVYVSGNNVRGDFDVKTSSSDTMKTHMIKNSTHVYAWTGTQGAKMTVGEFESQGSAQSNKDVNLDQKVTYSCKDWTPDNTKFVAPTSVKFIDLSTIINANGNVDIKALMNQ
ncbi:MAG: hypothetical protein M3Q63_03545 [bacterium]|nr:hypothetical protein [bacterium]